MKTGLFKIIHVAIVQEQAILKVIQEDITTEAKILKMDIINQETTITKKEITTVHIPKENQGLKACQKMVLINAL